MEHPTEFSSKTGKPGQAADPPPSPLAYGAMLLCLYVVMYLAVAVILHVAPALTMAAGAVATSLTEAERAIAGEGPGRASESGGRLLARDARTTIDVNCD